MPVYADPHERDAIMAILKELTSYYQGIDPDHLVEMVAMEAEHHGIQPEISVPFARQLIEKEGIPAP